MSEDNLFFQRDALQPSNHLLQTQANIGPVVSYSKCPPLTLLTNNLNGLLSTKTFFIGIFSTVASIEVAAIILGVVSEAVV